MDPGFERLKDYNLSEEYMISNKQNLKFNLHWIEMWKLS